MFLIWRYQITFINPVPSPQNDIVYELANIS